MATLLLVDDHAANRLVLECTVAPLGHEVVTVCSAQAAWAIVQSTHFDMVITDLRMDGMSGADLAAALFARPDLRSTPILLVSGVDGDDAAIRRALGFPSVTFVQKPYTVRGLQELVSRLLVAAKGADPVC